MKAKKMNKINPEEYEEVVSELRMIKNQMISALSEVVEFSEFQIKKMIREQHYGSMSFERVKECYDNLTDEERAIGIEKHQKNVERTMNWNK